MQIRATVQKEISHNFSKFNVFPIMSQHLNKNQSQIGLFNFKIYCRKRKIQIDV